MGVGAKLGITLGAVLITVAAVAYPASIYLGNKIYDAQLEKIRNIKIDGTKITVEEQDKTYNTRTTRVAYNFQNESIVFDAKTTFELTGSTTVITPNYDVGSLAKLLKNAYITNTPKSEITLTYTILGDKFVGEARFGEINIDDNKGVACAIDNIEMNVDSPRTASVTNDPDKILQNIRDGEISSNYNWFVPKISCASKDNKLSFEVSNLGGTGNTISYLLGDSDIKIGDVLFNLDKEYKADFKNILFTNRIKKGPNDTLGVSYTNTIESASFNDPLVFFFGGNPKQMKKLDSFNFALSIVDMKAEDFKNLFIIYPQIVGLTENTGKKISEVLPATENIGLQFVLHDFSGKIDDGVFKISGKSLTPIRSLINHSSPQGINAEAKVHFDDKILDAIYPGFSSQIHSLVALHYVKEVEPKVYESEIKFDENGFSFYGKHL